MAPLREMGTYVRREGHRCSLLGDKVPYRYFWLKPLKMVLLPEGAFIVVFTLVTDFLVQTLQ